MLLLLSIVVSKGTPLINSSRLPFCDKELLWSRAEDWLVVSGGLFTGILGSLDVGFLWIFVFSWVSTWAGDESYSASVSLHVECVKKETDLGVPRAP